MVTTSTMHAAETERRRKHVLEKAKAQHLSRQLQMRLQYARLKVEHGWQRQNPYEVENLYFHHSQQRGPRTYSMPTLLPTTAATFTKSALQSSQSSLSFRVGFNSSSLPRTPSTPSPGAVTAHTERSAGNGQAVAVSTPRTPGEAAPRNQNTVSIGDQTAGSAVPTGTSPQITSANQGQNTPLSATKKPFLTTLKPAVSWPIQGSPATQPTSTSSLPSSSTGEPFGYAPSALTYDSFWSVHSSSASNRSFRSPASNSLLSIPGRTSSASVESIQSSERTGSQ
ncbi:hypothetical protein AX16_005063 [Volvariella volvacea WC 439]|nr:hypothetical protein AX16_005063 [Volvariella volvacea WC 439]